MAQMAHLVKKAGPLQLLVLQLKAGTAEAVALLAEVAVAAMAELAVAAEAFE